MAKPKKHKPLPVKGYQAQSQADVDLVNEGKIVEECVLRYLDKVQASGLLKDARSLSIGKTQLQTGFMWAFRSVFNPQRIEGDL